MNPWRRSSPSNPCPVCGRTKDGDCRISADEQTVLCHTAAKDDYPEEESNGYVFTKRTTEVGGSLYCANYVLKKEKETRYINQKPIKPIRNEGVKNVLVKNEQAVEQISLAKYSQEPSPKINNTIIHIYPPNNRILRIEKPTTDPERLAAGKNYEKTFRYEHHNGTKWVPGEDKKSSLEAYRYLEQKKVLLPDEYILIPEGETNVEAYNSIGLAAVTFRKWTPKDLEKTEFLEYSKELNLTWVAIEDYDPPNEKSKRHQGEEHSKQLKETTSKHEINLIVLTIVYLVAIAKTLGIPIPPGWENAPPKGADLKDWIEYLLFYYKTVTTSNTNVTETNTIMSYSFNPQVQEQLILLITEAIRQKRAEMALSQINVQTPPPSALPDSSVPLDTINQKVCHELYGDSPWICVKGDLYKWVGTHYELRKTVEEERRIRDYLNFYSVKGKYPYASPSSVRSCLSWVRITYSISPDKINPPGINCLNGVVRINWVDFKPTLELIPHSPDQYYISEPTFKYAPDADSTDCLRLLEALEPMERTIFLKTVAASLDLPMVRKRWGRLVRALLCFGDGSNGKDALRECVSLIHGAALTACSLNDFQGYDRGRKFPLARLSPARINWSSENILHGKLDGVQSLKSAITGEQLSCEPKGKDEEEFIPKCVFLFNCNELPKVQGHQQAFASRYGILKFNKTFKIGANIAAGELEADPRFKYDPEFLKAQVMPAFLNIVLAELGNLMSEGINYSCVEKAMSEARSESNHLFQACQDIGLVAAKGEEILLKDVWESLYNWYLENKYVEEITDGQKTKKVWTTDVDKSDPLVKAPKDVCTRLKTVFGNSLKTRTGHGRSTYLVGVKFQTIELAQNLVHHEKPESSPANDYTPQSVASPVASPEQNLLHHEKPEQIQDNDSSNTSIESSSTSPESNLLHPNPNNEPTVLTTVDQRESSQSKVGDIGTLETDPIKFLYAEVCRGFKFRIVDIEGNGFIRVEEINGKSPILQVRTPSIHRRQFFPIG